MRQLVTPEDFWARVEYRVHCEVRVDSEDGITYSEVQSPRCPDGLYWLVLKGEVLAQGTESVLHRLSGYLIPPEGGNAEFLLGGASDDMVSPAFGIRLLGSETDFQGPTEHRLYTGAIGSFPFVPRPFVVPARWALRGAAQWAGSQPSVQVTLRYALIVLRYGESPMFV